MDLGHRTLPSMVGFQAVPFGSPASDWIARYRVMLAGCEEEHLF